MLFFFREGFPRIVGYRRSGFRSATLALPSGKVFGVFRHHWGSLLHATSPDDSN